MSNILTTIAILILLAGAAIATVLYLRTKAAKKALALREEEDAIEAQEAAEHKLFMEEHYVRTKNERVVVSPRIEVQITSHKIQWITVSDPGALRRTHLSYEAFLGREEPTIQERDKLDSISIHLENVRQFRTENVNVPVNYVVHKHLKHKEIIEYTIGRHVVGDSNRMAVVLTLVDGQLTVHEIHLAYDLDAEIADKFTVSQPEQWELFLEQYGQDDEMKESLRPEFCAYNDMVDNINKFNEHAHLFHYDQGTASLEFRQQVERAKRESVRLPRI